MEWRKQLTGFQTIAVYTLRKLLFSKRLYISLLIMVFIVAIMAYASTLDLTPEDIEEGATKVDKGVDMLDNLILFFFMPVMAMIYGSSLIRDEMDDRSITAVVTSPMDRVVTYIAYYIGLAISVSIIMLLILTSGYVSYYASVGFDGTEGIFGPLAALMVIGAFAYSALFIMISVLISQPIYFGLFYAFIWEAGIGSIPGNIKLLAIKHYVRSLGTDWISYGRISNYEATAGGDAAIVLIVFSVVVFIIGAIIFRRKEFP